MVVAVHDLTKPGYYDSVGGKVHTGERLKISAGITDMRNYTEDFMFIDIMRRISQRATSGSVTGPDANGWYDTSGGGEVRYTFRLIPPGDTYFFMKDYDWLVRWTGTVHQDDVTIQPSTGVSVVSSAANRKVFRMTVDDNLVLRFTGGTATDITMIPDTYETAFDGGQIITDEFIADTAGFWMLRYMDTMNTNNNTDFTKADYDRTYGYPQELIKITMRSVADISNATGTIPWINIPTYAEDQLVTDLLTELNTYYSGDVAVEWSNETWNFGGGFKNNYEWTRFEDVPVVKTSAITSGVINETAHGLDYGDLITMFDGSGAGYPYQLGTTHHALKIDNDNFGIAFEGYGDNDPEFPTGRFAISGATQAIPIQITAIGHNFSDGNTIRIEAMAGDFGTNLNGNNYTISNSATDTFTLDGTDGTGYAAYSGATDYAFRFRAFTRSGGIYYKYEDPASGNGNTNYANRSAEVWALADDVIGRNRCIHVANTQGADPGKLQNMLTIPVFRASIDYACVAPYFQLSGTDLDTLTDTEKTDSLINGAGGFDFPRIFQYIDDAVDKMGCFRVLNYEGNDATSFIVQNNVTRFNAWRNWQDGSEGIRALEEFYYGLADRGCVAHTYFKLTYWNTVANSGSSYFGWGLTDYTGKTSDPKWQLLNGWAQNGGAPKN